MKITGGNLRGRIIKVPKTDQIRPSTDKLRGAIFSSIGGDIIESRVADLFCGSGALGIEALSRGANYCLFVDSNRNTIACLKENLKTLDVAKVSDILPIDVFDIRPGQLSGLNIIFADPPYKMGLCDKIIALLSLQKFNWNGILVLEHESGWEYAGESFVLIKRIESGDSSVSILFSADMVRQLKKPVD